MISEQFAISAGSVVGAHHRKTFKNNQDAFAVVESEHGVIAVVCDGCGSGKYSEVGAQLGAKYIVNYLAQQLHVDSEVGAELKIDRLAEFKHEWQPLLAGLQQHAVEFLTTIAKNLCPCEQFSESILNHFLFTIIGVVITKYQCVVFSFGDGVFSVNGEVTVIDQNNTPEYLGYGVLSEEKRWQFEFEIQKIIPTAEVESLLIATDGFDQVYSEAETKFKYLTGEISVAEFCQFETGPKYLKNRSLLQKRLNVIGLNHGLLGDDTTVVLIRRNKAKKEKSELSLPAMRCKALQA